MKSIILAGVLAGFTALAGAQTAVPDQTPGATSHQTSQASRKAARQQLKADRQQMRAARNSGQAMQRATSKQAIQMDKARLNGAGGHGQRHNGGGMRGQQ